MKEKTKRKEKKEDTVEDEGNNYTNIFEIKKF